METTPESLARRFYADQVLHALTGSRVRLKVDVERAEFTVPAGSTGIAMEPFLTDDGRLVAAVMLDDPPTEVQEFDGELHWIEDINLVDFEDEVELA